MKTVWGGSAIVIAVALVLAACSTQQPPAEDEDLPPTTLSAPEPSGEITQDDLDYLVWEVCRQIRREGITPNQIAGILQDATRHGAIMAPIEAECGAEIAAAFSEESAP